MPSSNGILQRDTPVEDYLGQYGLLVKREDLACSAPAFSKTRGVYAHVRHRPESIIGVLDTYHSQAGHAVARMCQVLDKQCLNFYPEFKHEPGPRSSQSASQELGAQLVGIPAGRSSVLYHRAKRETELVGGYMMPNALKLAESVEETAKEAILVACRICPDHVIVPSSSGTIAAGVIRGFYQQGYNPNVIVHLGYSRSPKQIEAYLVRSSGINNFAWQLVDEGYAYKQPAAPGESPPWPCNEYYDLKAFRWWLEARTHYDGCVLFWNVG